MRTEYQTVGGGGELKLFRAIWKYLISFLLEPVTSDPWAHLMLRRSHPRMAVSLAVASWVLLWWGLHLPEVNFSCPLPSKVALLEIWRGKSIHTHTSQSMAAYSQRSLSRLVSCPGRPESGNRAPVNTPWRLKLLILMRVKETGLPLWDRNHTFHLFIGKSMSGAAVSLWVSLMAFLECSIGEFQWTKYRIYSLKYHLSYFYNVSVRDKGWGWINIYTIHQK